MESITCCDELCNKYTKIMKTKEKCNDEICRFMFDCKLEKCLDRYRKDCYLQYSRQQEKSKNNLKQ